MYSRKGVNATKLTTSVIMINVTTVMRIKNPPGVSRNEKRSSNVSSFITTNRYLFRRRSINFRFSFSADMRGWEISGKRDMGRGIWTWDVGRGTWTWTWTWDVGRGTWDVGHGTW